MLPKYAKVGTLIHISSPRFPQIEAFSMYYFMFQKSSFYFKKGRSYNLGLTQPWKNKSVDIKYSETGKIWLSLHHSERESLGSRNFHCTVRASDVGGNIPALRNLSANAFVLWAIHLPYFDIKKKKKKKLHNKPLQARSTWKCHKGHQTGLCQRLRFPISRFKMLTLSSPPSPTSRLISMVPCSLWGPHPVAHLRLVI